MKHGIELLSARRKYLAAEVVKCEQMLAELPQMKRNLEETAENIYDQIRSIDRTLESLGVRCDHAG